MESTQQMKGAETACCMRCSGLLVEGWVEDESPLAAKGSGWIRIQRCVNCGDAVDTVVRQHRQHLQRDARDRPNPALQEQTV